MIDYEQLYGFRYPHYSLKTSGNFYKTIDEQIVIEQKDFINDEAELEYSYSFWIGAKMVCIIKDKRNWFDDKSI